MRNSLKSRPFVKIICFCDRVSDKRKTRSRSSTYRRQQAKVMPRIECFITILFFEMIRKRAVVFGSIECGWEWGLDQFSASFASITIERKRRCLEKLEISSWNPVWRIKIAKPDFDGKEKSFERSLCVSLPHNDGRLVYRVCQLQTDTYHCLCFLFDEFSAHLLPTVLGNRIEHVRWRKIAETQMDDFVHPKWYTQMGIQCMAEQSIA